MSERGFWKWWDEYWFRPGALFDLAVLRLLIVGFQLVKLSGWMEENWCADFVKNASLSGVYKPLPIFRLLTLLLGWAGLKSLATGPWHYQPSVMVLNVFYGLTIAAGVLAFIGLWTNASLAVFAAGNIFLTAYLYSFGNFHHPEALLMIALVILSFSPAGGVLSANYLRRRLACMAHTHTFQPESMLEQKSEFARWPLLLIQWLFVLVYFSCALCKLHHGGLQWINGETLQYYLLEDGLRWNRPLGVWFSAHHSLVQVLSYFTMFFEGTFILAVIFPWLAVLYIPLGFVLHLGIYFTMDAAFFQFFILYGAFIPWAAACIWLVDRQKAQALEIFYDSQCPLCMRSMTILQAFDWFKQLKFSDIEIEWQRLAKKDSRITLEACLEDMHVLLPDGSIAKGFFAYRAIVRQLPPLWSLLAVLYFPSASFIGPKIYSWIASRRSRGHRCTTETCSKDKRSNVTPA